MSFKKTDPTTVAITTVKTMYFKVIEEKFTITNRGIQPSFSNSEYIKRVRFNKIKNVITFVVQAANIKEAKVQF